MANVLVLYERNMPTVRLLQGVFDLLFQEKGISCTFRKGTELKKNDLVWMDLLILVRPDNTLSRDVAAQVKKCGKKIIFFIDDDLFCLPESMPSIPWRQRALRKNLRMADILLSSNPYLCRKYKNFTAGKRDARIDTIVSKADLDRIPLQERDTETVHLVYAAGADHEELFTCYIRPILPQLSKKYGSRISLSFVGVHPEIEESGLEFEVRYYDSMPLEEYRKFMRTKNFTVGLAPLHANAFGKCKYFNKFLEYTMAGMPGIYSNCRPYTYVVKNGYNGLLAGNNCQDWYEKICMAVDDKTLRQDCCRHARMLLKEHFNAQAVQKKLMVQIPEFAHAHKKNSGEYFFGACKFRYRLLRVCDWMYLSYFYLLKTGVRGWMNRIRFHMRESRSYR